MTISGGLDFDPDASQTFRQNFPEAAFIEGDIKGVSTEEVESLINPDATTLFSGCAPCQPFSRQNNNRAGSDPRKALLFEFQRFITHLLPELIVIENVPGLQSDASNGPLPKFLKHLDKLGYQHRVEVLRALDFGVPQSRRRLVVLASRIGEPCLPQPTHGEHRKTVSTVRDHIADLPQLASGQVCPSDSDHAAMRLSPLNVKRIKATPEGGDRRNWDSSLVPNCHRGYSGHSDSYGRMWWDKPASGLTTKCLSYSNGRFGHPTQDRGISLREAACLQTFPRDYSFSGPLTSRARQVGNAVPPLLAQRIGESLISAL